MDLKFFKFSFVEFFIITFKEFRRFRLKSEKKNGSDNSNHAAGKIPSTQCQRQDGSSAGIILFNNNKNKKLKAELRIQQEIVKIFQSTPSCD